MYSVIYNLLCTKIVYFLEKMLPTQPPFRYIDLRLCSAALQPVYIEPPYCDAGLQPTSIT